MARSQTKLSALHPEQIKALVRMTGVSLEQVSLAHNYSKGFLSAALKRPLYPAEQIIAKLVGIKAQHLWPDRYDASGKPLHRGRTKKQRRGHLRLVKG
jgi:Ner family transcriptional regulator